MMRSATIIILHALVMQGLAQPTDTAIDKLVDKLVDKLTSRLMGLPSTAAQSRPSLLARPATKFTIDSLPGPAALKQQFVNRFNEVNGRCVSVKAETALSRDAAPAAPSYMKLMNDPSKTEPMALDKIKDMAGVTAPTGFFDPLGISTKVPEGQLLFFREAELKHGRVCMLAFLGLIVGERHDFFPIMNTGIPADLSAYSLAGPYIQETGAAQFWPAAIAALFFEEWRHEYYRKENDSAPGDYGWDPLGMKPKDAKGLKELQTKELNNGRLAMLATAGIIAQEQLTNKKILMEALPFLNQPAGPR